MIYFWIGLAGFAAAVVNSVAGGGTLLTFPALLTVLSPVFANCTSTVALAPASLAAAWGYRRELEEAKRWLPLLTAPSVAGGIVGSLLVTCLDPSFFDNLVPWLILAATMLFLFQPILARHVSSGHSAPAKPATVAGVVIFQFFVAVYGGYFGAGIGILMLSALGLMGIGNIHAMNGLKNFLAFCINGVSIVVFAIQGVVDWQIAVWLAPIAAIGAYTGARIGRRLNRRLVRWLVIAIGFGLAGHFFWKRLFDS